MDAIGMKCAQRAEALSEELRGHSLGVACVSPADVESSTFVAK
jgi:short-subunit dehydrogenase